MIEENVTSSEQSEGSNGSAASADAAPSNVEPKAPAAEASSDENSPPPQAADPSQSSSDEEDDDEEEDENFGNRRADGSVPDDIGNRPGGAAPRADGAAKKRRRRKKKGPKGEGTQAAPGAPGAPGGAEGAEGAEASAEGAEASAEGEASEGDGEKKERRGDKGPPRERPAFSVGEEVFGRVCKVTDHAVWVDIAGKAIGLFDRRELQLTDAPVEEGDQFIATVASSGVRGGMLMLSQTMPELDKVREHLEGVQKSGDAVEGFVTGAVKGGLEVDLGGLRAFAPASHVDLRHGADLSPYVGQRLEWVVTTYAKKGRDIVVSRKRFLEEETKKHRAESLSKLEPGTIHKGIVRKVVAWGVFVALPDADNVEGLVHLTEASHDRGAKLQDLFKPGSEIDVKVLRIDDKGKLWLSRKGAVADPWDAVKEKYAVGTRHKAKVARIQPFGAFMELEPGLDGLIHTADISQKPINHPDEVVKVGDEMDVVVASCDSAGKRIGLHPALPDENEPRQKVVQYKVVQVEVTSVVEGGLVVRVLGVTGRHARAFIPAGHTGTPRGTDLRKEFPPGNKFDAKVLEVDPRRGEAKLSIRALKEDVEKQAYQQYRTSVAKEAKFGTFGDLLRKAGADKAK
ncbi:MAG: S1 RNA-binding domain-containing protein [Polyangiaceae bacterium]|nr:S1 RNA-binding domain-containing protein [Polyangiaceae bacterium]